MKCGKPVRYKEQEYCYDCSRTYHYFDRGAGLWLHKEPVSTSIYQFKYHNQRFCADFYALEMAGRYGALITEWSPEAIVPVPLHSTRRRKRGYNQAEILADEIGGIFHIPVLNQLIRRVKDTDPQKKLDHRKRKQNIKKAFVPAAHVGKMRAVLIIDDIYTTGATIDAVAKVLKDESIQKVYFLTVSIGQGD